MPDQYHDGSPEDVHVETLLQVAEIFSDLQLAETFASDEESGNRTRTVFYEPLPDQVTQPEIRVPVHDTNVTGHIKYLIMKNTLCI